MNTDINSDANKYVSDDRDNRQREHGSSPFGPEPKSVGFVFANDGSIRLVLEGPICQFVELPSLPPWTGWSALQGTSRRN